MVVRSVSIIFQYIMFSSIRKRRAKGRRGAATVEFAICLPVLVILTIGTLDVCSMLFLKESITLAAYEGARRGVQRNRTNADATDRVIEFLDERGDYVQHSAGCQVQQHQF